MSGRPRTLFRVARTMISDEALGLVSSIRNHGSRCDCWQVLDVKRKGKELRRWGMWNSRNREDRDPGSLA